MTLKNLGKISDKYAPSGCYFRENIECESFNLEENWSKKTIVITRILWQIKNNVFWRIRKA